MSASDIEHSRTPFSTTQLSLSLNTMLLRSVFMISLHCSVHWRPVVSSYFLFCTTRILQSCILEALSLELPRKRVRLTSIQPENNAIYLESSFSILSRAAALSRASEVSRATVLSSATVLSRATALSRATVLSRAAVSYSEAVLSRVPVLF